MTRWEWIRLVLSEKGPQSPTVRHVLVTLFFLHYNEERHYAWPKVTTLSVETGFCERTTQRALEEADESGWLRRDAEPGKVTVYRPAIGGATQEFQTPDRKSPLPPTVSRGPPTQSRLTPDRKSPDRKEGTEKEGKEGGPPCPLCSSPTKKEKPRRPEIPPFWGCVKFRETGCKGKVECDPAEIPSPHAGRFKGLRPAEDLRPSVAELLAARRKGTA